MLIFPRDSEFNRRIPKQKFYENLPITPALKRCFVEQIDSIRWKNKISPETSNFAAGVKVKELQVFSIALNNDTLDEEVLKQIDRMIPYHILFLLEYDGKVQAWIGYKEEAGSGTAAFKVNQYYHTDWARPEDIPIKLDGLNLDAVYENLVRQMAGDKLESGQTESLKEAYARSEKKALLEKQIAALQAKIRKEKQLNVQMRLSSEMKALKKELEGI